MSTPPLSPGFASPVADAQRAFRALLDATARPGTLAALPFPSPPGRMPPAMAAVALTLVDAETPVWLDEAIADPIALAWLRFHCGCRIVPRPEEAVFALASAAVAMEIIARIPSGTDEYPDTGATAVISVGGFDPGDGGGERLRLIGPGIDGSVEVAVSGLPRGFVSARAATHRLFPRGIDTILVAGAQALCLPRSTRVTAVEG